MRQTTYRREPDVQGYHSPVYPDADDVPLERDLRQRYRTRPPARFEEDQGWTRGYDSSAIGMLAMGLGAAALLAWYGTRSERSEDRMGWSRGEAGRGRRLPMDETDELIASNKVEGTTVYDRDGDKIGTVHNFMVGKRSGRVAYAVVSFGGFLGFGGGYHPLPWNALTYDEGKGGYVVNIDKDRLRNAPRHQEGEDPFVNPAYGRQVTEYWLIL
jgi:hypothetical protein